MRDQILNFQEQFTVGRQAAANVHAPKGIKPSEVLIAGMGGSAVAGKVLTMLNPYFNITEYANIAQPFSTRLTICISWSGNTAETIRAYEDAVKNRESGVEVISITKGGQLAELATKHGTPLVILPHAPNAPRAAVGYMTGALLEILGMGKLLDVSLDPAASEQTGRELATAIGDKTPIIYAPQGWKYLANFWKILFNENCKLHAFWNSFPSLDHNELAGFNQRHKDRFYPIFIKDNGRNDDKHYWLNDPQQDRNTDAAIAIIKDLGYNYSIVDLSGETVLEKVFQNYVLGLWTSYYLAQKLGVDPEDITVIETFKQKVK